MKISNNSWNISSRILSCSNNFLNIFKSGNSWAILMEVIWLKSRRFSQPYLNLCIAHYVCLPAHAIFHFVLAVFSTIINASLENETADGRWMGGSRENHMRAGDKGFLYFQNFQCSHIRLVDVHKVLVLKKRLAQLFFTCCKCENL